MNQNTYPDDMPLDQAVRGESKYLSKEDCGSGLLVTIAGMTHDNLARDGEPPEHKPVLHFQEPNVKPMILNVTNREILQEDFKVHTVGELKGLQILLYHDRNVSFGGKRVGGIRIGVPPQQQVMPEAAPEPVTPGGIKLGGQHVHDRGEDPIPF